MIANVWDLTAKKAVCLKSFILTNIVIKQNEMLAARDVHSTLSESGEIDFNGEMVEMGKNSFRIQS